MQHLISNAVPILTFCIFFEMNFKQECFFEQRFPGNAIVQFSATKKNKRLQAYYLTWAMYFRSTEWIKSILFPRVRSTRRIKWAFIHKVDLKYIAKVKQCLLSIMIIIIPFNLEFSLIFISRFHLSTLLLMQEYIPCYIRPHHKINVEDKKEITTGYCEIIQRIEIVLKHRPKS